MNPTQKLTTDQAFFFENAGWCFDPLKETREEGRTRCALNLAAAEALARESGLSFQWTEDRYGAPNEYGCILFDSQGNAGPSLWAIGFRDDESPWGGDPYRRVVEAELAAEFFGELLEAA